MRRAIKFQLLALVSLLVLVMVFSGILAAVDEEPATKTVTQVTESVPGTQVTPAEEKSPVEEAQPADDSQPPSVSGDETAPSPDQKGEQTAPPVEEEPADQTAAKDAGTRRAADAATAVTAASVPQAELQQDAPAIGVVEALVWEDTNGNGIADESPPNLMDGVTVNLYRLTGGQTFIGSKVTGPGAYGPFGVYQPPPLGYEHGWVGWNQLPTNYGDSDYVDYMLEMVPPPGYHATGAGTTRVGRVWAQSLEHPFCWWRFYYLNAGNPDETAFSLQRSPELDGYKYADLNENQKKDDGEPGISGVTINLDGGADSAVTDQDGYFRFTVSAGTHSVSVDEATAPGYYPTTPTTLEVQVPEEGKSTVYFGNAPFGSISGHKYRDVDANGELSAGDLSLGGVTIKLTGKTTFGEDVSLQTVTAEDGTYSFTNLKGGVYTVSEVVPDGMSATSPTSIEVTLKPGDNLTDRDFFNRTSESELNGYKFVDLNENGKMDEGEVGIEGVTINLDVDADSAVTDEDGFFSFTVQPGNHTVTVDESTAPGYYPTTPTSVDVEVPENGSETVYFGNATLGSISGYKYEDTNKSGKLDSGDSPIAGWTIRLIGQTNVGDEQVALETLTGVDGSFKFEDLKAGTYAVSEVVPADWSAVTADSVEVTLLAGEPADGVNFLNVQKTGTPPPPVTPPTTPPTAPTFAPSGTLPFTGANLAPVWLASGLSILAGLVLLTVGLTRRRRAAARA